MVDVLVVDDVTSTVLFVECTVLSHVLVKTLDHANGETDEAEVVHHPRWSPVHRVIGESSVPCRMQNGTEGSGGQDEHILLPHRLCRRRTTQLLITITLGVANIRCKIHGSDELPQCSLGSGLQMPRSLGSDTVNLVVSLSCLGIGCDRLLAESPRGVRRRLITSIVGCDGGDVAVSELLIAHRGTSLGRPFSLGGKGDAVAALIVVCVMVVRRTGIIR